MTCTAAGRPPWSLYETCLMRRPMPSGGIGGESSCANARCGHDAAAARPSKPFRCFRRSMLMLPSLDQANTAPEPQQRQGLVEPGARRPDHRTPALGLAFDQRRELLRRTAAGLDLVVGEQ